MRYVTLIDLGAGQLPAQTPPAARFARWFPEVYAPSAVPPVGGTEVTPVADGVLLEWDAVDSGGSIVIYIIERSESPDGPWQEVVRTTETRYLYSDGSGLTWYFRITATVRGVAGGSEVVEGTAELVAKQAAVDAAMEEALRASLNSGKALALFGTEYSPDDTYTAGSVIYKDGRMYRAKQEVPADTPPPDPVYWEDVGTVTQAQAANSTALSQLRVDVDEQGNDFAAAITQVNSGLANVTTAIKAVGGGGNLLQGAALGTLDGWFISYNSTGSWSGLTLNLAGDSYHPPNINAVGSSHAGVTPAIAYLHVSPVRAVAVEAGKKYVLSAYGNPHRSVQDVFVIWRNVAGAEISRTPPANTVGSSTSSNLGNNLGAYWTRVYSIGEAPAGATSATIVLRNTAPSGVNQPYAFWCRPMFEEVPASQEVPSAWSAGGEEAAASYTVTTDVNGYVSGMQSMNDGKRSSFSFLADVFRVFTGGAASGMEWQANYIRVYGNGYQLVMGTGFGSAANLVQWFGPNVGAANCTTANCVECKTTSGQTIIRGTSTQGRMEIMNTAITIYDANNRRRFAAGLGI